MVWCEVPDDVEDEFNRWYNDEHIEERLSIPGILSAARYEAVMSGPKHLAVYELENSAVMESDEYLRVRSNPTEWSKRMSPEYTATTYVRNVYEMIHPSGADRRDRVKSDGSLHSRSAEWTSPPTTRMSGTTGTTPYISPTMRPFPASRRGRRYTAVKGTPAYLTMYEFDHTEVSKGQEWLTQQTAHPDNARMREAMIHLPESPGVWRKTFELGE